MQERNAEKMISLSVRATKMTANVLKSAIHRFLAAQKNKSPKVYKGKQSVKRLAKSGEKLTNIEITDENIKSFSRVARKYGIEKYGPNRYHIVTAKMGFHGRTFGAMSATGQPGNGCQVGFGPMTYGFSYAPYNDLQAFKDACTENTIAIMIEPVQGEGGVHPATQEFMQGLREFCDEKGMLLLIDEVQTGWCRTGKIMSYMHYGIKPDIVSMAKALGGGMPIGAICATAEVAKAFTPGSHGTTFGGHPVSCAAALAQVGELLDRDLAGNAEKQGKYFMEKLKTLPHVKEVRGQGLLVGVEFDDAVSSVDVKHECLHRHLLLTAIGAHVIRMVPPLIITEEDCDEAYDIIKESVEAILK